MSQTVKILFFPAVFFCLIFQFYVPLILNSAFLATFLCLFFIRRIGLKSLHDIILEKRFVIISFVFFLPFIYALFYNVFISSSANDYSYIKLAINGYIYILCTAVVSALVIQEGINKHQLTNYLLLALLIQSLIIIGALSSSFIFDFVRSFQSSERAMRDFRALTLSGPLYFALSIMIIFYLFFYFCLSLKRQKNIYKYFIVGILCLPFLTVGRTLFMLPAFCLMYGLSKYKVKLIRILCTCILMMTFFLFFIYVTSELGMVKFNLISMFEPIYNWVFEIFINFSQTGQVSSESTDMLQKMYFPLEPMTLFFGDGQYTGIDGKYYMHTDAGFMRNVLLFGIFVSLFLVLLDVMLLKTISSCYFDGSDSKIFFGFSLLLLFTLHYKGEVFGYSFPLHIIIFTLYFCKSIKD